MKITFVVYHDVLEDKVNAILQKNKIDTFTEWEHVIGKFHGTEGHLGTRTFPGHRNVKMIPFTEESELDAFVNDVKTENEKVHRKEDIIRVYLLPLEAIV